MDNTVGSPPTSGRSDPVTTEVCSSVARKKLKRAKNRNSFALASYYTPASLLKDKRNIPEYITGYIDGEGCFTVTFNIKEKAKLGWELRPSFSVSQNEDKRQVLDLIREYFGCGYIRRDYSDRTVKFEIRDHNDLMERVIPHFDRFPFLSAKRNDFELFRKICERINRKKHLRREGFIEILNLAYLMNNSGKRKRTKREIIKFLG
jgi:hypothetical protein